LQVSISEPPHPSSAIFAITSSNQLSFCMPSFAQASSVNSFRFKRLRRLGDDLILQVHLRRLVKGVPRCHGTQCSLHMSIHDLQPNNITGVGPAKSMKESAHHPLLRVVFAFLPFSWHTSNIPSLIAIFGVNFVRVKLPRYVVLLNNYSIVIVECLDHHEQPFVGQSPRFIVIAVSL
jgi:hypothetical protein